MELPVFEMVIDPNETSDVEVSFIALVDKPAIEKNFLSFKDEDDFGGPGSGRRPEGGGGGGDDDGDISKVLAKPRHERSEDDIKKIYKRKTKKEVKESVDDNKRWLKVNKDKSGTPEHKARTREVNVGDRILRGHYHLHFDVNEERRIISGPAMISNSLIYRRDDQGEYNVFFSKETVKEIALKFFKKDYHKNLNLFHDPGMNLEGVTIFESFISDPSRGIQAMKGFEDLPEGTWFISAKVENDDVWAKIKSGEVKGFSVEGLFSYKKRTNPENAHIEENGLMSKIENLLTKLEQKFFGGPVPPAAPATNPAPETPQALGTMQLKDGTEVTITALEVGGTVTIGGTPAPAGEHELMDGTKVTVGEGGVITAVQPGAMAPAAPTDYSAQFTEINEKFTAYEQRFADYEGRIKKAEESLTNANNTIVRLVSLVEKMAETPTADPSSESKNNFQSQKVADRDERRKELAVILSKIKKN